MNVHYLSKKQPRTYFFYQIYGKYLQMKFFIFQVENIFKCRNSRSSCVGICHIVFNTIEKPLLDIVISDNHQVKRRSIVISKSWFSNSSSNGTCVYSGTLVHTGAVKIFDLVTLEIWGGRGPDYLVRSNFW